MLLYAFLYFHLLSQFTDTLPVTESSLTYDVIVHDRPVGQLKVTKALSGPRVHYQVEADVALQLLGHNRMISHFSSTYSNNLLTEASYLDQLNGRIRHESSVRWNGSSYQIRVNKASSTITNRQASYSTASLYDREPTHIDELFSERYGRFCSLRCLAPHTYELSLPDGKKNIYRYRNGVCQEVDVQQPWFNVHFRLRPD